MPFRIFEVTSGPTPYPIRFVVEQDRRTTADNLAETIRATGALTVTVAAYSRPFNEADEANREAARLAEEHRTGFTMYRQPADSTPRPIHFLAGVSPDHAKALLDTFQS